MITSGTNQLTERKKRFITALSVIPPMLALSKIAAHKKKVECQTMNLNVLKAYVVLYILLTSSVANTRAFRCVKCSKSR